MKLPPAFKVFTRREWTRILYLGGTLLAAVGGLVYGIVTSQASYDALGAEMSQIPEVDPNLDLSTKLSKEEGKALETRRDKYLKIRKKLDGFVPREGGKPAPMTINDIVLNIPKGVDVEKSERYADETFSFTERDFAPLGSLTEAKAIALPVFRYQSVAYSFSLRSSFHNLLILFKQLDEAGVFYFLRQLSIRQPTDYLGQPVYSKEPKLIVEMIVGSIYLLKDQGSQLPTAQSPK
jgi:hypothetical protein